MITTMELEFEKSLSSLDNNDPNKIRVTNAMSAFKTDIVVQIIENIIQDMSNLERSYVQAISVQTINLIKDKKKEDHSKVIASVLGILCDPIMRGKVIEFLDSYSNNQNKQMLNQ